MVKPVYVGHPETDNNYIQQAIDAYSALDDVLAWKMAGAGGGGYLALVVKNSADFATKHSEAILLKIRRE